MRTLYSYLAIYSSTSEFTCLNALFRIGNLSRVIEGWRLPGDICTWSSLMSCCNLLLSFGRRRRMGQLERAREKHYGQIHTFWRWFLQRRWVPWLNRCRHWLNKSVYTSRCSRYEALWSLKIVVEVIVESISIEFLSGFGGYSGQVGLAYHRCLLNIKINP